MRGGGGGAAEVGDDGFTGVQRDVAAVFKRPDAAAGTGMHNDQARTTLHTCYALPPRAAVYKKKKLLGRRLSARIHKYACGSLRCSC